MDDADQDLDDVEDLEDDSPMVLDTSQQQEWRVPENGEDIEATAEISLFPEYEQVLFGILRYFLGQITLMKQILTFVVSTYGARHL